MLRSSRRSRAVHRQSAKGWNIVIDDSLRYNAGWLTMFLVAEAAFQIGLYLFGNTFVRMPLRIGVFGFSLAYLFLFRAQHFNSPSLAARLVKFIAIVLAANLIIPGAGLLAGVAQGALYIAVLAPLVWVNHLQVSYAAFRRVVLILWAFHSASAFVGALQVEYPGRFDGAVSENIDKSYLEAQMISTADGTQIMRPKGLTDQPGGAGASGLYAIILSFGLLLTEGSIVLRIFVVGSMTLSLFSIFLSQIRTNIVLACIAEVAILLVLVVRKDQRRTMILLLITGVAVIVGTSVAFAIGGTVTVERFATLIAEDPQTVAYQNRGQFLDALIQQDILRYPVGAGGGRWGMINSYFGDTSEALFVEMQWQAFLCDGGLQLIGLYIVLIAALMMQAWKIARSSNDEAIGCWAGIVIGFNLAAFAASFVFPVFIKDSGLEMMLLNGCLLAISQQHLSSATRVDLVETVRSRLPAAQSFA